MLLPVSSYCALCRYSHAVALCFVLDNTRCGMFCILCLYNASNMLLDIILYGQKQSLGQQKVPNLCHRDEGLRRDAARICRNGLANEPN